MDAFLVLMSECMIFLQHPFIIWGYEFSFWNVLIFVEVFSIVMNFVFRLFGGQEIDE